MNSDFMEVKPTSTVGGIIGALIGAVIGAIPWVVVMYFGWFIGYLAFLIAFVSFFGYRLLNGPKNKTTAMVAVLSCSIVLIFVMNFVMIAFILHSGGFAVDKDNIMLYIELSGVDFYKNVIISLIIGVAGAFGIGKTIDAYVNPQTDNSSDNNDLME